MDRNDCPDWPGALSLANYCRKALINWARNAHRDRKPSEAFDEHIHSSSIACGARAWRDPIRDAEVREAVAFLYEAVRRRIPARADRLVAWLESGGDPSVARALGLSRTTLQRDRRILGQVLQSMGWDVPESFVRHR